MLHGPLIQRISSHATLLNLGWSSAVHCAVRCSMVEQFGRFLHRAEDVIRMVLANGRCSRLQESRFHGTAFFALK